MAESLAEAPGRRRRPRRPASPPRPRLDLIGLIVEATGLEAEVGEVCEIATGRGRAPVPAEVVGFRKRRTLLMPLGELHGIGPGNVVTATGEPVRVPVGDELLGRVLDGLGRPIDQGEELPDGRVRSAAGAPPDAARAPAHPRARRASACASSTAWSPAGAASAWASSPARAWASRRCWA